MGSTLNLTAIIAVLLSIYLCVALLKPEKFS